MDKTQAGNIYLITYGEYSAYGIYCIVKSPRKLTAEQLRTWHLEAVKRSADFAAEQAQKLAIYLGNPAVKSTNYYAVKHENSPILFEQWEDARHQAGVSENPCDWLECVLKENDCEILAYEEFNLDDLPVSPT